MEFLSPKPISNSAVHPIMPKSVMNILFLYLKMFLAVTLCENFSLRQMRVIFSRSMRLLGLGAFGRIRDAGTSLSPLFIAYSVVSNTTASATAVTAIR